MKNSNRICYCGSGKKYKKCHSYLEYMEIAKPSEIGALFNQWPPVKCMHHKATTSCGKCVSAHTVPRSSGLSPLARDGHVITYFGQNKFSKERLESKLIGINKASTFFGFCPEHDNQSFKNADTLNPASTIGMCENIYRALVYEKYKKLRGIEVVPKVSLMIRQKGPFEYQEMVHQMMTLQISGLKDGCDTLDLNIKKVLSYLDNGKSPLSFCIRSPGQPTCAMSVCYSPEFDLNGNKIQSLKPDNVDDIQYVCIIMFYKDGYNYVLAGAVEEDPAMRSYLKTMHEEIMKNFTTAIAIALNYCENVYFSPDFFDSLTDYERGKCLSLIENWNANMNPFTASPLIERPKITGDPEAFIVNF